MKAGTKVRISKTSGYYARDSSVNPRDVTGVITLVEYGYLGFSVDWSNGEHNNYNEDDLVVVKKGGFHDMVGKFGEVDDEVVFNPPHYKGLYRGTVTKVTKTAVQIDYAFGDGKRLDCSRNQKQVVVV